MKEIKFLKRFKLSDCLSWSFKAGSNRYVIQRVWNDYCPKGVKPSWEYWIWKIDKNGNNLIENFLTLKEAREFLSDFKIKE